MTDTIHLHSSDERFCGCKGTFRQFTVDEAKVTCPACKSGEGPLMALTTVGGTACPETVLLRNEYTPEWRARIEQRFCRGGENDPLPGTWCDVSDNEACRPFVEG